MSRIRSVATSAAMNRRTLLAATGAVTLSAGIGYALPPDSEAHAATTDTGESAVAVSLPHSRLRSSGRCPIAAGAAMGVPPLGEGVPARRLRQDPPDGP